ncbi:MAG: fumarylacetoacetate hydrolase family protein [Phycisphaerae bacterium]|nr:fumarylacetoacetate hydrolase family protein [Phycisphaerae bacterium]
MRIARFLSEDGTILSGALVADGIARPLVGDLFTGRLPRDGDFADDTVGVRELLAPVSPPNIFAIGRNYADHVAETGARRPEKPLIFMKPTTAVTAPEHAIVLPSAAPAQVDFEAELAVVVGRQARAISVASAPDHVLGYTCANDVTARDCQAADKQWSRAKGFDTFCPLGPWIVTPDALDPTNCRISSRLNGELMQSAVTDAMVFSALELLSFLSHQFTLLPGTVILTGTPAGVGFVRQPPVFLRGGDRIEVDIEGIGTLSNPVSDAPGRDGA